jgi:hypothetical protein
VREGGKERGRNGREGREEWEGGMGGRERGREERTISSCVIAFHSRIVYSAFSFLHCIFHPVPIPLFQHLCNKLGTL